MFGLDCLIFGRACLIIFQECLIFVPDCLIFGQDNLIFGRDCLISRWDRLIFGLDCLIFGRHCLILARTAWYLARIVWYLAGIACYGPWALCHQTLGPQTLSPKYLKSQGPRGREPEVLWILGPLPSGPWDLKYSGLKVWGPNVQGPEAQGLYGPRTFWGDVCIKKGSWFFSFGIRSAIFWHLKMTYLPWLSSEHTGAAWPVIPVGVSTCSWSIHWFLLVWVCRYLFNTLIYAHNHKCRRPYDLTELDFFDHSAPLLFLFLFPNSSQIKIGLLGTAHCRWVS